MTQKLIYVLVGVIALSIGAFVAKTYTSNPTSENATQYFQHFPEPRQLAEVNLVDQHGEPVNNAIFKGHWSLLFLGYTYCPDICPTTMASISKIYPAVQQVESEFPFQVVFVSVDPQRDKPERLASYIEYFNNEFIAVTGEHDQLFPLSRSLGLMYAIAESTENPNYLIDHSASVVMIDPNGLAIGRFKPKFIPGELSVSDSMEMKIDIPILIKK